MGILIERIGQEVEAVEVKENIGFEALQAPTTMGLHCEARDLVVDQLREGAGETMRGVRQNARPIGFYIRLEPAAIQMPPSPPLGPVNVGALAAHRTARHLGPQLAATMIASVGTSMVACATSRGVSTPNNRSYSGVSFNSKDYGIRQHSCAPSRRAFF